MKAFGAKRQRYESTEDGKRPPSARELELVDISFHVRLLVCECLHN